MHENALNTCRLENLAFRERPQLGTSVRLPDGGPSPSVATGSRHDSALDHMCAAEVHCGLAKEEPPALVQIGSWWAGGPGMRLDWI